MTFESTSDRELWLVRLGKNQFPIYARQGHVEGEAVWHVTPAVDLIVREQQELLDYLAGQSRWAGGAHCYIPDITKVAVKAPGITPEFYHLSESSEPVKQKTSQETGDPVEDVSGEDRKWKEERFARYVFNRLKLTDWTQFKFIYSNIFALMPAYMALHLIPINLGWATLATFPLRANWKQILLSKFPGIGLIGAVSVRAMKWKLMVTDFGIEARRADLLGLKPFCGTGRHHIRLTPELIPNEWWFRYADKVERRRLKKATDSQYVNHVGALIERTFPDMVEAFLRFMAETRLPCGNVVGSDSSGGVSLVALGKVRDYDPRRHDHSPVKVVTDVPSRKLYPVNSEDIGDPVSDLPEVSLVREAPEDMRFAGSGFGGVSK